MPIPPRADEHIRSLTDEFTSYLKSEFEVEWARNPNRDPVLVVEKVKVRYARGASQLNLLREGVLLGGTILLSLVGDHLLRGEDFTTEYVLALIIGIVLPVAAYWFGR
ncbi:MAG: hypothetical protein JXQ72_16015 [Anaerolineae bacterium]|nr:hypothetical protein [Anaerolineae bacterium]